MLLLLIGLDKLKALIVPAVLHLGGVEVVEHLFAGVIIVGRFGPIGKTDDERADAFVDGVCDTLLNEGVCVVEQPGGEDGRQDNAKASEKEFSDMRFCSHAFACSVKDRS